MSETPTIEQVMERIRAQVRQQQESQQQESRTPPATVNAQKGSRYREASVPSVPDAMTLRENISQLHAEVRAALDGHLQTGQLNPRRPGLHNDVLQFIKKVMRRSLTWYTRPLHRFQASVVRALENVTNLLQKQGQALLNESAALRQVADQVQTQSETLREAREQLQMQSGALREAREQLQMQSDALRETREQVEKQRESLRTASEQVQSLSVVVQDAAERALSQLMEQVQPLRSELSRIYEKQMELELKLRDELEVAKSSATLAQQNSRVDLLHAQVKAVQEQLRQMAAVTRGKERDLRRISYALETSNLTCPQPATASTTIAPIPPIYPSEIRRDDEFDYFLFEDYYRGNEAEIRGRQNAYIELFRGREGVVDIGCGRGEFLEMLRDNDIPARGVELGTDQYLLCREKGLDVIQQDLFTFLESQPDASLGGMFSAQVIEHMTASDQLRFVSLAYQKCSPQSPVVFETINPECVYALVHNFFLDPTHVRPVHPGTLKFAMESRGFRDVQLRFSSPVSQGQIPRLTLNGDPDLQPFNLAMERLNELLYGHQDYAAIGWK